MTTAVAVALYNGERFIEKQMDCLRLQTQAPDQVVFCDDGSTDRTVELVKAYIERHRLQDRWKLYVNERNLGYVRNFYKAVRAGEGDLVFLCDQDDIWEPDKIRKMTQIMQTRADISLLCCQYGIIDAGDNRQHSIVEANRPEDETVRPVRVRDIMRGYRWPGMAMCLRRDFFDEIFPDIGNCSVAHDLVFAVLAADRDAFYEYSYVGVYHRRHDNNVAKEEHRISRLLNLERKLADIAVTKKLWHGLVEAQLPMGQQSMDLIRRRLELLEKREEALREKSLRKLMGVYGNGNDGLLRVKSLVCDLWLVMFGKNDGC